MLEVQGAIAKVKKYAVSESGDTVEMVERPEGGISFVMADGQRSGRSAKMVSNIVVRKVIALLADGVRDGAAARAANDYLRIQRGGKVSADLVIVSVDLHTRTLVISRNTRCPVVLYIADHVELLDESCEVLGFHRTTRPVVREFPLQPHMTVLAFTDGLLAAGTRRGKRVEYVDMVRAFHQEDGRNAQRLADSILSAALELDEGRPIDDVTVLALTVYEVEDTQDIRRLHVRFPVPRVLPATGV